MVGLKRIKTRAVYKDASHLIIPTTLVSPTYGTIPTFFFNLFSHITFYTLVHDCIRLTAYYIAADQGSVWSKMTSCTSYCIVHNNPALPRSTTFLSLSQLISFLSPLAIPLLKFCQYSIIIIVVVVHSI